MGFCACGAEIGDQNGARDVCPACLLRLALEPEPEARSIDEEPPRLLGPVGRGPHGTVHLAVRPDDEPQLVTIKVIETQLDVERFSERVRRTADLLRTLREPGFADILDTGLTPTGHVFVVAAYISGPSLADYDSSRRNRPSDRMPIAARLCSLVARLHSHGIVHGSLKRTNVIVTESSDGPLPVLLDVGIVAAIDMESRSSNLHSNDTWFARDQQGLHELLADWLGAAAGLVAGTESPAALADLFANRAI